MTERAATWIRVSSSDGSQTTLNQVPDIDRFTTHRGYDVTRTYDIADSAWKQGPDYRAALDEMLADAHRGHFDVLVIWSLDRIIRSGPEEKMSAAEQALRIIRKLSQSGVKLVSVQESWLNGDSDMQAVLVSFAATMAELESRRKSERVRAGMARARAEGKVVGGRKPGARDRKRGARATRSEATKAAWSGPGGDARRASVAARNASRSA